MGIPKKTKKKNQNKNKNKNKTNPYDVFKVRANTRWGR